MVTQEHEESLQRNTAKSTYTSTREAKMHEQLKRSFDPSVLTREAPMSVTFKDTMKKFKDGIG